MTEATFDDSDPDHVTAVDPPETLEYPSQITLWRELLTAPEVKQGCLVFRMIFRGTVKNFRGHPEAATTTFVLCGAPRTTACSSKPSGRNASTVAVR